MALKELCVATDYMSDLLHHGTEHHYNRQQLDDLMAYSASLGAKRHEWVADTWLLDKGLGGDAATNGAGFEFLPEVCAAAHRHGLRLDVVFKPLEGTMPQQMRMLPESFPRPDGVPLIVENGGLMHAVWPFLAENPDLRIARAADQCAPAPGSVAAIRLHKPDDRPLNFAHSDLSVWTAARNGGDAFIRYDGPLHVAESLEFPAVVPRTENPRRVVTISGFDLPADTRYVMVRCARADGAGEFCDDTRRLMTLVDDRGNILPATPSAGPVDGAKLYRMTCLAAKLGLSRYVRHPDVLRLLEDRAAFMALCSGAFDFKSCNLAALDRGEPLVIMLGKACHIAGSLHPVYPAVREYWRALIAYCLDCGADGVNIRVANHNRTLEPWAYGFNPPVAARMQHAQHAGEAARINGDAYTGFLREAADLIHGRGREIGVHVNSLIFTQAGLGGCGAMPLNFDWQWRRWIREIADYVEFRGAGLMYNPKSMRPDEELIYMLDQIGLVARAAGVPFMLQSSRMTQKSHFDGTTHWLERQLQWVRRHPDISIYNLYETVAFTRLNREGRVEGSPVIRAALAAGAQSE